jgi:outer membrane protein assembly factor BamD
MHQKTYFILIPALLLVISACGHSSKALTGNGPEDQLESCLKLSEKKHFEEAIECLGALKARYPKSQQGQEAELRIADNYFRKKDFLLAAESYKTFIKLHPLNERVDYAYYRLGSSYLAQTPKAIDRDQEYLDDAIRNFNIVIQGFPASTYKDLAQRDLAKARLKIAKRNFYVGRFYYRTGEYIAAIPRFMEVAKDYPDSGLGPESLSKVIHAAVAIKQYDTARDAFSLMSTQYASSPLTPRAQNFLIRAAGKIKSD